MWKRTASLGIVVAMGASLCGCAGTRPLDIYFVDMVGGAATFVVTPAGESILVDSGSALERDAGRIHHVVHEVAGLSRIDHVITTHWHLDHYGALGLLEGRVEFGRFYDRGIPDEVPEDPEHFPTLIAAYRRVSQGRSTTLRAGDEIPLKQARGPRLTLRCLMADAHTQAGEPTGQANPYCDRHQSKAPDTGDNGKSIVTLLSYGDFDFLNPGDLTWNLEKDLVCPVNRVGQVELLQVSHHGFAVSNNPVCVHAVAPKAAVILNGPHKGADVETIRTLRDSPGLVDIWQIHRNVQTAEADNAPPDRVVNWDAPEGGTYIRVRVDPSGECFQVQIGSAGPAVRYTCWQ